MTIALMAIVTILVAWWVSSWRWKHICDMDVPDDVYLSRLMLVKTPLFGVYFHIIRRPDWSRCQHDHPWPFVTFILLGGYIEEVGGKFFTRNAGYVGFRPRSFEHRITHLLSSTAWTLVVRGRDNVEWGFRTKDGRRLRWQDYVNLPEYVRVLWCKE